MKNSHENSHGHETEEQLINRAQEAVSQCRWVVGECAALWTKRYARGRTDADFAALLNLTGDQVFQRRRVWEKFGSLRGEFKSLRWSHFYAALTWDDVRECLDWAEETQSTVAEMRAWRRARRGEDLTSEPMPDEEPTISYVPTETEWVQDPSGFSRGGSKSGPRSGGSSGDPDDATLAGVSRHVNQGDDYTPFRKQARGAAPKDEHGETAAVAVPVAIPPDQLIKRLTSTLERCVKVLTPEFTREFRKLPEPLRNRFLKIVGELSSKAGDMM